MSLKHAAHQLKCEIGCESLASSGALRLRVNGWSMIPTVWPGDVLIISKYEQREVQAGDIVLYRRAERLFVHRLIGGNGQDRQYVVTRGDSMPESDPPLPRQDLLGKIDCIVRNGRRIAPAKSVPLPHRAIAALVQSADIGARAVFGVRNLYQSVQPLGVQPRD
jgi:signal peptidase I